MDKEGNLIKIEDGEIKEEETKEEKKPKKDDQRKLSSYPAWKSICDHSLWKNNDVWKAKAY